MNLDDKIFEALESCRLVCETYDGHPEPESLKTFRDSYQRQLKKGIDKKNALKIAGFDGIADRTNKRARYHSQRSLKKMDLRNPNAFDEMEKEMQKGQKEFERGSKLAQRSLNRK